MTVSWLSPASAASAASAARDTAAIVLGPVSAMAGARAISDVVVTHTAAKRILDSSSAIDNRSKVRWLPDNHSQ
jgi:quinolinate synthase